MKIRNLRCGIAVGLLLASILNHVDRQGLSIPAPTIQADLGLSDADYGRIASFFPIAYTVGSLLSGRIGMFWVRGRAWGASSAGGRVRTC